MLKESGPHARTPAMRRMKQMLRYGVPIAGRRFEFLAFSAGQVGS